MKYYVYVHRKSDDKSIFYVGKGTGKRANSKNSRSKWWHRVVNKHGFYSEIVQYFNNECDAYISESTLINHLSSNGVKLINLKSGGVGGIGFKHSEESKQKIRNYNLGKTYSVDRKQAISKALLGNKFSRKRKFKFKSNNRKTVICLDTGEIFQSAHEAALKLNLNYSNIAAVCRGKRNKCGGLRFEYAK
jgi:hypothetical protein